LFARDFCWGGGHRHFWPTQVPSVGKKGDLLGVAGEWRRPVEHAVVVGPFWIGTVQNSSDMWIPGTETASACQEFSNLTSINLNLNSHMGLVTAVLHGTCRSIKFQEGALNGWQTNLCKRTLHTAMPLVTQSSFPGRKRPKVISLGDGFWKVWCVSFSLSKSPSA
jgi:hypothetical protein